MSRKAREIAARRGGTVDAKLTCKVSLGRYELLQPLAQGGMAETWRARLRGETQPLVVKKVLPHLACDPSFVEAFVHEGRLAARLTHPNVVRVVDFGGDTTQPFLAMELVDGCSLADLFKLHGPLPVELVIYVLIQVLDGLQYVHSANDDAGQPLQVVHRDISPDNVLLSWAGDVKIADFGVARAALAGRPETRPGLVKGKLPFMSPEQMEGRRVDAQTDVYAVGVMAYRLLTGQYPFSGEPWPMLQAKRASAYAGLRVLRPDVPLELERFLSSAMAGEKEVRALTAAALKEQLEAELKRLWPNASRALVRDALARAFGAEAKQRDTTRRMLVTPAANEPPRAAPHGSRQARRALPFVLAGAAVVLLAFVSYRATRQVPVRVEEPLPAVGRAPTPAVLRVAPYFIEDFKGMVSGMHESGKQEQLARNLVDRGTAALDLVVAKKADCAVAGHLVVPEGHDARELASELEILDDGWFIGALENCEAGTVLGSPELALTNVQVTTHPWKLAWLGDVKVGLAAESERGVVTGRVIARQPGQSTVTLISTANRPSLTTYSEDLTGASISFQTDADGHFKSPPIAQGWYRLAVAQPNRPPTFVDVVVASGTTELPDLYVGTPSSITFGWSKDEEQHTATPETGLLAGVSLEVSGQRLLFYTYGGTTIEDLGLLPLTPGLKGTKPAKWAWVIAGHLYSIRGQFSDVLVHVD